jgi:hypothetical protein
MKVLLGLRHMMSTLLYFDMQAGSLSTVTMVMPFPLLGLAVSSDVGKLLVKDKILSLGSCLAAMLE